MDVACAITGELSVAASPTVSQDVFGNTVLGTLYASPNVSEDEFGYTVLRKKRKLDAACTITGGHDFFT